MAHTVEIKELINGIQITETIDGNVVINEFSYQAKPFIRSTNESDEETYQVIDKVGEVYNIPALATEFVLIDLNDSVYIPANGVELIESSLKLRPFRPDNERDEFHIGEIATTSNSLTINLPSDNVNWAKIGGVFYEKYYPDTFNFTPVVTFLKILILYAKPDAQVFYLAQGVESSEAEDPDYDGLLIAKITVNTSGQIVEVSNQDYKKKEESNWNYLEVQSNATPLILELPADVRGSFYLTKAVGVGVITVEAIKRLSIGNVAKDYMYGGRELLLFNATGGDIIIDSSAATDTDSYFFSDRITPFTLKTDTSVLVKLRGDVIELLPSGSDPDLSPYALDVDLDAGLALKVDKTTTVNGKPLSANVSLTTTDINEGSNLYFTVARVLATVLTGISFITGTAVVSTDTILVAFGKVQKQITDILATVSGNTTAITALQAQTQVYKTISGNTTIDDSYHNTIVTITANSTITFPTGLRIDFNCVFDTDGSVIGTFTAGSGITFSAPFGVVLSNNAMCTVYRIASNRFRINGGLI